MTNYSQDKFVRHISDVIATLWQTLRYQWIRKYYVCSDYLITQDSNIIKITRRIQIVISFY